MKRLMFIVAIMFLLPACGNDVIVDPLEITPCSSGTVTAWLTSATPGDTLRYRLDVQIYLGTACGVPPSLVDTWKAGSGDNKFEVVVDSDDFIVGFDSN